MIIQYKQLKNFNPLLKNKDENSEPDRSYSTQSTGKSALSKHPTSDTKNLVWQVSRSILTITTAKYQDYLSAFLLLAGFMITVVGFMLTAFLQILFPSTVCVLHGFSPCARL